jgi:hypothetical protein
MYWKIRSRLLAAISATQRKRDYALEDVFWVPIGNCESKRSTSRFVSEVRSEKPDNTEPSKSGNITINADWRRLRGHDSAR